LIKVDLLKGDRKAYGGISKSDTLSAVWHSICIVNYVTTELNDALWWYERTRAHPTVSTWLDRFARHDLSLLRHSLLVGAVASIFAWAIDIPEADREAFMIGALLHDVGKLMIAPELLHKRGPLSSQERKEIEGHADGGYRMLCSENLSADTLELVHLHHERLDGSGYPNGLKGDQLTRLVRMISICDVFSALIEDRVYRPRPARPLEIMLTMTEVLDADLLRRFANEITVLAYEAKDHLDTTFSKLRFAHVS